jgi:hypothetical protein
LFPFTDVVGLCIAREKLLVATEKEIFHQIGLLLMSSGDEDGGVVQRKKKDYEKSRARKSF